MLEKGATAGPVMILACSGGSNVGQLANQAAAELTMEGAGAMFCLAGIGGRLAKFVEAARQAPAVLAVDGCEVGCVQATLLSAGLPAGLPVVLTAEGIAKNKNLVLDRQEVEMAKAACRRVLHGDAAAAGCATLPAGGCCSCGR